MHVPTCVLTHHMGLLLLFLLPYINPKHFQDDKSKHSLFEIEGDHVSDQ